MDKWDEEEKHGFTEISFYDHKDFPKPEHEGAVIQYRGDWYQLQNGKWVLINA